MYSDRDALRLRGEERLRSGQTLRWLTADANLVHFARGGDFVCFANLSERPVDLPPHRQLLLTSLPIDETGRLPTDATAWLRPLQTGT